jgi:hypothetical protein
VLIHEFTAALKAIACVFQPALTSQRAAISSHMGTEGVDCVVTARKSRANVPQSLKAVSSPKQFWDC